MANFKVKNPETIPQDKKYQRRLFEVLQSLEEWEEICPKCCASGIESHINGTRICRRCNGKGKISWIDNLVNKGD